MESSLRLERKRRKKENASISIFLVLYCYVRQHAESRNANCSGPNHQQTAKVYSRFQNLRGIKLRGSRKRPTWHCEIPKDIDVDVFSSTMFQWATTLTTSGQNMPFVLPQKVDKTKTGFEMDFLKSNPKDPGSFVSVGTIEAKVEEIEDGAKILFLRGYGDVRIPKKLVDVPIVMQTMPNAIKRAIKVSIP